MLHLPCTRASETPRPEIKRNVFHGSLEFHGSFHFRTKQRERTTTSGIHDQRQNRTNSHRFSALNEETKGSSFTLGQLSNHPPKRHLKETYWYVLKYYWLRSHCYLRTDITKSNFFCWINCEFYPSKKQFSCYISTVSPKYKLIKKLNQVIPNFYIVNCSIYPTFLFPILLALLGHVPQSGLAFLQFVDEVCNWVSSTLGRYMHSRLSSRSGTNPRFFLNKNNSKQIWIESIHRAWS